MGQNLQDSDFLCTPNVGQVGSPCCRFALLPGWFSQVTLLVCLPLPHIPQWPRPIAPMQSQMGFGHNDGSKCLYRIQGTRNFQSFGGSIFDCELALGTLGGHHVGGDLPPPTIWGKHKTHQIREASPKLRSTFCVFLELN